MSKNTPITVAYGDGIGPSIMQETLKILKAAGARLDIEEIEIGEKLYLGGHSTGIDNSAWDSLNRTGILLKAPITTPFGGGYKSLNVTLRKTLGLFANVRPAVSYHPFVKTNFPGMDIVVIRENEEDLYAGIEHRHTVNTYQCLKILTRPGTERICRFAFEYAQANGRKKVTCMIKDNIMKFADGMFYNVFQEIGKEYPNIEKDRIIVDIGAARVGARPHDFDVIVTTNLYGDIVSDIAAEVTGSVGLGGSSNIGRGFGMFEAIHGSAPDIAGLGIANPSGLILGAVQMLVHIGQGDIASKVHNAWFKTLEDGIHTGDIYREGESKERVGTEQFGDAVIARLDQKPQKMKVVHYPDGAANRIEIPNVSKIKNIKKELVGVDVFIDKADQEGHAFGDEIDAVDTTPLKLITVAARGVMLWPNGAQSKYSNDHWCCRFMYDESGLKTIRSDDIIALLQALHNQGYDVVKTENLYNYDGERGYTLAQGQ